MARHLADWVESDLAEVSEAFGRGVDQIISYGSYNCRTIGNREGGRLSTHGFAASIDIAGFTFDDGRTISLLSDWDSAEHGPYLRALEQSFRPTGFTRVLGPDDNAPTATIGISRQCDPPACPSDLVSKRCGTMLEWPVSCANL